MTKNLICVTCPRGCNLTVDFEGTDVKSVTGNFCKRGEMYAKKEIIDPTRSLATTVKVNGGIHPVVPVKSSSPVPKNMLFECMKVINATTVDAPVELGQVIVKDILGTGSDIVATNYD
mgnify:CR=1 FL=1